MISILENKLSDHSCYIFQSQLFIYHCTLFLKIRTFSRVRILVSESVQDSITTFYCEKFHELGMK